MPECQVLDWMSDLSWNMISMHLVGRASRRATARNDGFWVQRLHELVADEAIRDRYKRAQVDDGFYVRRRCREQHALLRQPDRLTRLAVNVL